MEYIFSKRAKNITMFLMVIGLITIGAGFFNDHSEHHNHFWTVVLSNSLFFLFIGFGALFFYALQYATETAWSSLVKRIFEGIFSVIPYFAVPLVIVLLVGSFGGHHIYHWMDPEVHEKGGHHFDAIIHNKSAYLNLPFFWIRTVVYLGTIIFFARWFRNKSVLEDKVGGTEIHFLLYRRGALFLVFFAVFSSMLAWDWVMSIDPHWFSTLFGWYVFSGMWVGAMITAIMVIIYLKSKGLLTYVNDSHIHDLGKWMFAISFLWTYLWFSQFMLIWYSNIPEEVTYFKERIEHFRWPFFGMFVVNFVFPMLMLMSRAAKRRPGLLIFVGTCIFLGHWMDTQMLIQPGATHHFSLGWMEIGTFLGFLGLFVFVVLRTISKASLYPKNHPFVDESLHHHI